MYIHDASSSFNIDDTSENSVKFEYSVRVESDDKDAITEAHQMLLQSTLFTFAAQYDPASHFWYSQISWFKGKYFFNFTFDAKDINLFLALRDNILAHDANKLLSILCVEFKEHCDIRYELKS
jgi:hypothetical protein